MMGLKEIRGKKANEVRWESLKLTDWTKDAEVIERITKVDNPRFFSSRTPEQVVEYIREEIKRDKEMEKRYQKYLEEHGEEMLKKVEALAK